jgi:hypothetical protein
MHISRFPLALCSLVLTGSVLSPAVSAAEDASCPQTLRYTFSWSLDSVSGSEQA